MKKWIALAVLATVFGASRAFAESLQWQVPDFGLINLNINTTESLVGYDGVLKQALAGFDLPIYTSPLDLITLKVGADAPWQTEGSTVEPMILAGHNILGDIPALDAYSNLQLNIFGRWAAESGKAGAGIAFTYSFAGGTATTTP
jgi:hypothetical protein